jgi:enamine deaminase RidA (YjgF/YER057c/UK114 family)
VVEQFDIALRNLDACLKAAGGGPEHVVKVTVFLTDVDDRPLINPARQRYFGQHRPASTLVEVSALVLPKLKVEIEAQAVLP